MSDKKNFDDDNIDDFEFLDDPSLSDMPPTTSNTNKSSDTSNTAPSNRYIPPGKMAAGIDNSDTANSKSSANPLLKKFQAMPVNKRNMVLTVFAIVIGFGSYYVFSSGSNKSEFSAGKATKPPLTANQANQTKQRKFPLSDTTQQAAENVNTDTNTTNVNATTLNSQDLAALKTELFAELMESAKSNPGASSPIELQENVQRLNTDLNANTNTIRNLQTSLKEISQAIAVINSNLNMLDKKIAGISGTVATVNRDMSGVKKIIADEDLDITNDQIVNETIKYREPDYTVHAVIPGRAWLKDKSGAIITVAEGDTLGKYGTVSTIDINQSIVSTSSGTSFR